MEKQNMRVLWFTNTSSCYSENGKNTTGGGWISSLENELKKTPIIKLGICFYYYKTDKGVIDGTTYYPLNRPSKSILYSLKQIFTDKERASLEHEDLAVPELLKVVNDFKPDIIQVFGSENIYGILVNHVDIPIVLHIQGVLSTCYNTFLPPGVSWNDYLFADRNLKHILSRFSNKFAWSRNVISEQRMFKKIKYVIGRTNWDKEVSAVLGSAANLTYYHCDEILRDAFYVDKERKTTSKIVFVTTISAFLYKGYDVVLKTANILKNTLNLDFEWRVYGWVDTILAEKKSGLHPENVNVRLMGLVSAEQLQNALLSATAYVHTSYIENGCNAVGEAQMLGCPCIACNVGGINMSIDNNMSGYLVPSNDIYMLAYKMNYLAQNPKLQKEFGYAGRTAARKRHDKISIANRVVEIYHDILKRENRE